MISSPNLVPIDGSHRDPLPGAEDVGPASRSQIVTVTVLLKPQIKGPVRNAMSADVRDHQYLTREALEAEEMADPRATARVMRFATESGLTAIEDESGRRVEVSGTVDALNRAFGVQLRTFRTPQVTYRGRTGALNMPAEIAVDVEAVLGLDDRPQVRPGLRLAKSPSLFSGYPPAEIAKLYDFPTTVSGAGQCIGIAEFGGGFDQANLDAYFKAQGIATVEVKVVGVAGGHNQPGVDQNADSEVMLDIEVAHSVAPDAKIVVYFAPNTSRGFVGAVTAALHDKVNNPSVLSISWGGPEGTAWTTQAINALESVFVDAAKVGLTVLAASGDDRARATTTTTARSTSITRLRVLRYSDAEERASRSTLVPLQMKSCGTTAKVEGAREAASAFSFQSLPTKRGATSRPMPVRGRLVVGSPTSQPMPAR